MYVSDGAADDMQSPAGCFEEETACWAAVATLCIVGSCYGW